MKTEIREATVSFFHRPFRKPLRLSTGLITEITEARAQVAVKVDGREAIGRGTMYLSDLWAWPDPSLTHAQKDAILRKFCEDMAGNLASWCGGEAAHPLELGLRLHHSVCRQANPPLLARAMCASPFDAAIHDATGIALGKSAFDLYSERQPIPGADSFFESHNTCDAIQRILREPVSRLDAWWIIGASDALEQDVAPHVRERGYRCFKLKLLGKDSAADVARTIESFRAIKSWGISRPRLSADSNEANPDSSSVLDYLQRLQSEDAEAYAALEYLEQPTSRDILEHKFDWRAVTKRKPVLVDEGLTRFELFQEAVDQGWSGFALKTCKGHSFALVAAAWALENRLLLSMQDLTNPGLAAIHAALFASRIPMLNGVELNSPQYTPSANLEWLPRMNGLFEPQNGVHRLEASRVIGLGSTC